MVAGNRFRFRIRDVDVVVLIDVNAAGTAELRPLVKELAVLIEYLDAVVVAIADKQPPLGIHSQRVGLIELARGASQLPPRFNQLTVLGKFQNTRGATRGAGVTFGDEDVTIRRDEHVVRLKEVFGIASSARFTQRHEKLAIPAEFENLMAFASLSISTALVEPHVRPSDSFAQSLTVW